jgi:hypothetical protein
MASAVAGAGCLSDMIAMQHSTHHRRSLNSKVFFTEVGPDLIDLDHWRLACLTHSIYERSRYRELPRPPTAAKKCHILCGRIPPKGVLGVLIGQAMALHVISLHSSNSVASGAKRTLSEASLKRIGRD